MLTQEENDLLTQTGPGTPGGDLIRRYWQPIALAEELPPGAPPLPVRVLSEDLVLFRDEFGRVGLLGVHCSHRSADLSYGRIEDGGLRCLYHGWLYDIHGNCLDQPGEPADSRFKEKIHHTAYPCQEKAGLVFAYLGPGEPPLLPAYEGLVVPDEHRWVAKYYHECNYLQGNEGNQDPTHPAFLHGFLPGGTAADQHPREGAPFRGEERLSFIPDEYAAEETDYGARYWRMRSADGGHKKVVSIGNFVMPNLCAVRGGPQPLGDGYLIYWHVPIDDGHHWRYAIAFKRSGPLDQELAKRRTGMLTPEYRFVQTRDNRYMQDREEMRTETFAGFGTVFVVGDHWVTESAGPIQDRTQEHLGAADFEITAARRMMLRAIRELQEGGEPPHVIRSAEANDLSHLTQEENVVDVPMSLDEYRRQRALPATSPSLGR